MRMAAVLLLLAGCGPSVRTSDGGPGGGVDAGAGQPDGAPGPRADGGRAPIAMYAHSRDTLFEIDPDTLDLTVRGAFGIDDEITDLAVTPEDELYAISRTALYQVNPVTGAATYRADVPGVDNVGMTFLPDGTLLATDKAGGVRRIDPASGQVTEVGEFGGGYATAGDLVAVADGTMYAISDEGPVGDEWGNNVLLIVDVATGVAAPVGQINFGQVFGCGYSNGHVYAFTEAGSIIEIDRLTGAGSERRTHAVEFWGAAVSPLVPVVD
jgi:hypothetical protein